MVCLLASKFLNSLIFARYGFIEISCGDIFAIVKVQGFVDNIMLDLRALVF